MYSTDYPSGPFVSMAFISVCFALVRAIQAMEIWNLRINLLGKGMMLTPLKTYLDHASQRPSDLWLGKGFLWQRHHTQRLYDVRRTEEKHVKPPDWYARLRGKVFDQQSTDSAGLPWIHGVGDKEDDIHLPFSLLEGNSLILGTTGSGKSTLLRCIISACIRRGDCVIVIDPKGDRTLVTAMEQTCAMTPGRQNDFVFFNSAFATKSVRYDVLKNFDRVTSIASRISAQIPSKTGSDQFVAFSWRVLLVYSMLLVACGERPTIAKIRRNVETGIEPLLMRSLVQYFDYLKPTNEWRKEVEVYVDKAKNDKIARPSKTTGDQITGYVEYYKVDLAPSHPLEAIDAGVNLYFHDRAHFGKMISSLMPTLAMLDAGEMGGLLSPQYDDIDDLRPIWDSDRVVSGNKCLYLGLDALSDSVVSSAIGSIIVADLAAVAGARYNYGTDPRRITLIVDEANEVVSAPFHQLASKGRGAGFTLWAASQTIPDFVSRLGSQDKALATLGNFNNLICLRVKDAATTLFVSEQFGKAFVDSKSYGLNTSSQSDSAATGFTGGEAVSVRDQLIEVVPPDVLGMLPNHQFFALLAGGKLYKGRQPVLSS
jgi:conjugal transfer pilus assembly protein TraD